MSGNIAGQESCEDGTLGLVQSKTSKAVNVHPGLKAEQDGDDGKEGPPTDVALIIQNETAAQEGRHDQLEESQDENTADEALTMIEELEALFEQAVKKMKGEVAKTWKSHDSNEDGFIDDSEFPEKKGKGTGNGGPHEMKVKIEEDGRVSVADCIEAEVSDDLDYLQKFTLNQMAPKVAQLGDPSLTLEDLENDLSKIRQGKLSAAHVLQPSLLAASEIQRSPEQQNLLRSANATTFEMSDDQDKESEILVEASSSYRRRRRAPLPPPKKPQTAEEIEWGCQDKKNFKHADRCKELEKIANLEAWGAVQMILKLMTESDFCWRKHYDRGAGWARICKPGYHQHLALCYKDCRSGYHKVGDHCWENCDGWEDWGLACCRWTGWWWPRLECKNKRVYHQPPGTLYSSWSKCPDARPVDVGGMCYKHPEPGYSCTVTACNEDCKGIFSTNCGAAACASSTASCVKNVGNMIVGSLKAMIDTALLIATGGASGTMKLAATMATKNAAKNAARKNIKRMAARIGTRAFKEKWIKLALRNARARLQEGAVWSKIMGKWFAGKTWDTVKSSAQDHAKFVAMEYYIYQRLGDEKSMMNGGKEGKIAALIESMEKMTNSNAETDLANFGKSLANTIDFIGLKDLIDKMSDPEASFADQAGAWLGLMSNFDPSGWLAAAANFAKPICEEQNDQLESAAATGRKSGGGAKSRSSGGSSGGKKR